MPYKNILLIDDDEDDQEIFITALQKAKLEVNCTALVSAHEALDMLTTKKVKPDIIFLDLNMPVMNGQQFLKEIKRNEVMRDIPVIVLSTSSQIATIEQVKALGAKDFFSKPNKFEDLIFMLNTILGDQS